MPGQFFSLLAETEEDQPSGSQLSDLFKKRSSSERILKLLPTLIEADMTETGAILVPEIR